MTHFIELTQKLNNSKKNKRVINVAVEKIDFYYDNHIVFTNRAIDVLESYEEITKLIYREL